MIYKALGLMSGSSLDGLDIVFVELNEVRGKWYYEIIHADCMPYSEQWIDQLKNAMNLSVKDFLKLNTAYGRYLGEQINLFIDKYGIEHQVNVIASHGHTVMHEPATQTTMQIGEGSSIAAATGLPVVSDLRNLDVALGGQGAPIVPIGDRLLFGDNHFWLNIGGIANVTAVDELGNTIAFDICPANQILNALAKRADKSYDDAGSMARSGSVMPELLQELSTHSYYEQTAPKSLSNEQAMNMGNALLESNLSTNDLLRTGVELMAQQIANAVGQYPCNDENIRLLATGGGALNTFLMEVLQDKLNSYNITVAVPDVQTIQYKEAIVMALIGVLRWREETNVLSNVTGAKRDSIGGALWMGHSYS